MIKAYKLKNLMSCLTLAPTIITRDKFGCFTISITVDILLDNKIHKYTTEMQIKRQNYI